MAFIYILDFFFLYIILIYFFFIPLLPKAISFINFNLKLNKKVNKIKVNKADRLRE